MSGRKLDRKFKQPLCTISLHKVTYKDLISNTVNDIKEYARRYAVPLRGTKEDLVNRILRFADVDADTATESELEELTVKQLKHIAKENKIKRSGTRAQIINHILNKSPARTSGKKVAKVQVRRPINTSLVNQKQRYQQLLQDIITGQTDKWNVATWKEYADLNSRFRPMSSA